MWISFIAGWILGSVSLYVYMVATAKEPDYDVCMECRETACGDCHTLDAGSDVELKRAA